MKKGLLLITLPITLPLVCVGLGLVALDNAYHAYKKRKKVDKDLSNVVHR